MKQLNQRRRKWTAYLRHERKAGRIGDNYVNPNGYYRLAMRWAKRGDWRARVDRKWGWVLVNDND